MVNLSLSNQISDILLEGACLPLEINSIRVSGSDAFRFLQGQVTADLRLLDESSFISSCVLDRPGRILSHFFIQKYGDQLLLHTFDGSSNQLKERLEQYLIADDVELSDDVESFGAVVLSGPAKERGQLFNLPALFLPVEKLKIYSEISEKLFNQIVFFSGETLLCEEYKDTLVTDTVYSDTSLSLKKGCFLGQETVAKIDSRRGAAKKWSCVYTDQNLEKINDKIEVDGVTTSLIGQLNVEAGTYLKLSLKREQRIEGKKVEMLINEKIISGKVIYFPIEVIDTKNWAEESFYQATDLFHANKVEDSILLLKKIIALRPDFEDAYETLGVILGREERFSEALEYLKKLEVINPDSVLVHTNLSLNYMKLGEIQLAEEHKSLATIKSFEVFGKDADAKRLAEDQANEKTAQQLQREKMFKEVLELDVLDAMANLGMGEIELDRSNFQQAQIYLEKALKTDEKYSVAYLRLGEVLVKRELIEDAIKILKKGIEVAASAGNLMTANQMQALLDTIS